MSKRCFMNKRGMTVAEVIIAIAVISVVTVSALSLVLYSENTALAAQYKTEAQYFALDALECFRVSADADEFESAMDFRGGYTVAEDVTGGYIYKLENGGYVAIVTLSYGEEGQRPAFSITVRNGDGDVVSEIIDFRKGGH